MPVTEIERCERRFAAVATNLSTGRELWFTEGDLHLAIRASCSMPGLMSPVRHNGYWLVDGAVVNPVPVSLTRAMGADIVIAVDLQHDAHLMQQDLFSLETPRQEAEEKEGPWHTRLRALDANEFPPYGRDADGDGDHDHLYPVHWKTVLNAIVWRVTRRISCCSHTVRKFRRLIFIAPERRSPRGNWR